MSQASLQDAVTTAITEEASGSPETLRKRALKIKVKLPSEKPAPTPLAAQPEQAQLVVRDEELEDSDDGVEVDDQGNVIMAEGEEYFVDQADIDAEQAECERELAQIRREYNAAGRPKCQQLLPNGAVCDGFHDERLHDEGLAVEAQRLREAHALVQERAPDMLRPAPTQEELDAKKKQKAQLNKQKHKDKRAAKRLQIEEAKKASGDGDKPKDDESKPKGKSLAAGENCPTCGKRHRGECRKCPCGKFHNKDKCPTKGVKPQDLVPAPPPRFPAWQGQLPPPPPPGQQQPLPPFDRGQVLSELVNRARVPQAVDDLDRIINAGQGPNQGGR